MKVLASATFDRKTGKVIAKEYKKVDTEQFAEWFRLFVAPYLERELQKELSRIASGGAR